MKQKSFEASNIFSDRKNWLLHILWCPIHNSSEILTFERKTLYNCMIGNLNSEQLISGQEKKSKIVMFISDETETLGEFNISV